MLYVLCSTKSSSSGQLVCDDCQHKFKNTCTLSMHKVKCLGNKPQDVNLVTLQQYTIWL